MSKISDLIAKLCPNGVEYKKLGECVRIRNGSDYKHLGPGKVPVYGSGGIMTYVDEYVYDKPSVLIPRKGSIEKLYYVDSPFWTVDTLFYTEINVEIVGPRYLYYVLQKEHLEQYNTAGGVPSLTQKVLNDIPIPVPPVKIQREVVEVLDKFALLTAELTAELEKRKKQYEHYRDKLLKFTPPLTEIEIIELGEVIKSLNTGLNPRRFFQLNTDDAMNYYVTIREMHGGRIEFSDKTDRINDEAMRLCNNRSNLEKGDVLFSGTGTIGEMVVLEETPTNWNIKEGVYTIKPDQTKILPKFLRYILMSTPIRLSYLSKVAGGTVKSISMGDMKKIKIPLPTLKKQAEVVALLDKFDKLCNDLTSGLPAEIAARKKQYEYYRDKLLNFKRAA